MRVLVADDDANVRYALRSLMEDRPEFESVIDAVDAAGVLAQVRGACPDLVLIDWELSGLDGAALLAALRELCPDLAIIVLSGRPEVRTEVLYAGADSFVSKMDHPGGLSTVIDQLGFRRRSGPGDTSAVQP